MAWLEFDRYEVEFLAETTRFGAAVIELDPQTPVTTCPGWTVRDHVAHVGTGHRWATEIVKRPQQDPPPYAVVDAPHETVAWAGWLIVGARGLVAAIRERGPDRPVWTWQSDKTAGFWLRKMLHDEVIHRFDAELAGGCLGDVAPLVAIDGVSDWLESVATLSRPSASDPVFLGLVGSGETLQFQITTPGLAGADGWHVTRSPAGVVWRHGYASADALVRAPARDLLLVLNRRLDTGRAGVEIIGDRALFTHWLEHAKF